MLSRVKSGRVYFKARRLAKYIVCVGRSVYLGMKLANPCNTVLKQTAICSLCSLIFGTVKWGKIGWSIMFIVFLINVTIF
jgi:hypothetical protein